MISIQNVSKNFTTRDIGTVSALKTVNLTIGDNEFFTLLGPSGCGKTTLLRLIGGFESPTTGAIRIGDVDVATLPPQARPVNTVFQSYALFPHMTVAENVAFGLRMQGRQENDVRAQVVETLQMVRLSGFANRHPGQLSGGQQQRVALARALAPRPRVLLLDEPLSALDLKLRKEMQGELKRLQRETGITFILVTHDQEEALAMSDRIAVMHDGKVLQVGRSQDIYHSPNCRFVADFIGEANLIPGAILGRDPKLTVAVRPERVLIWDAANAPAGYVKGTVNATTFLGLDTLYEVDVADHGRIRARIRDIGDGFVAGQSVILDWADDAECELLN